MGYWEDYAAHHEPRDMADLVSRIKLMAADGRAVKPNARGYRIKGRTYRRVSTVLNTIDKPGLLGWQRRETLASVEEALVESLPTLAEASEAERASWVAGVLVRADGAAERTRNQAANRGRVEHHHIAVQMLGATREPETPVAAQAADFRRAWGFEAISAEATVWDEHLGVAGTVDAIGFDRHGRLMLVDWKTGSGPYPEAALQLGAYAAMLKQRVGQGPDVAAVVKLSEHGYEVHEVADLAAAGEAFRACVALHAAVRLQPRKWWDVQDAPATIQPSAAAVAA